MKKVYKSECLDHTDFSKQCLIGIKFVNCLLRFCDFSNSDLSYTFFDSCDLYCSNFDSAIIYTTRIHNCDLTKAKMSESYLSGIRINDSVVTYTDFGFVFKTGMERKLCKASEVTSKFHVCQTGPLGKTITEIENEFDGIHCTTTDASIRFLEPTYENWRIWRRKSEIAKVIKNILEENGYNDKSLEYYFYHRKFLRKSMKGGLRRFIDYFWGQLFWGYGTKISNPVFVFFINTIFFSLIYSCLPLLFDASGMKSANGIVQVFLPAGQFSATNYLQVLYGSFLVSSLSVFGDIDLVGWAKLFSVFQVLISILSLGLGMAALTKRMANV